jgi:hypothetical protein
VTAAAERMPGNLRVRLNLAYVLIATLEKKLAAWRPAKSAWANGSPGWSTP